MQKFFSGFLICIFFTSAAICQNTLNWPKVVTSNGNTIKVYEPVIEQFSGNELKARAAISVIAKGKSEPVFGAIWLTSILQTDRTTRIAILDKIRVDEIKFSGDTDTTDIVKLKSLLEKEIPKWDIEMSLDELEASIEGSGFKGSSSDSLATNPPKILYSDKPSTLVLIDGEPKLKENKDMGVEMVLNTAFTIAKKDNVFYLYGSNRWYSAKTISGPWTNIKTIPRSLEKLNASIKEAEKKDQDKAAIDSSLSVVPEIIVSIEPAELIQSNGEANFSPIQGTSLLYMTNTNNDIFMNIGDQQYYVLLSGRWYKSASLKSGWVYNAADKLPADFANIPDSSEKSDVLASVAGTPEAQDAVMDAQVPQTAKVDRKTATTKVTYNGDPKFTNIDGTNIQYALNTSSTVLVSNKIYYCVDNGIWFQSKSATGPWTVSDTRPADVNKIPAEVPVYNVKYVYIYDVTPTYVYVGYTPGYMGSYVYGGTVIYGTGYYYNPWYGPYYYPRPVTYGFSMHYNPWTGWGIGFHYSAGWFNAGVYWGGYHGGYWGPPMYRPPYYHHPGYPPHYHPPYYPGHGYRPPPRPIPTPHPTTRPANNARPAYSNNNIYQNNKGVSTRDRVTPMPSARPAVQPARPSVQPSTRPSVQPSTKPAVQPARPSTGGNGNRAGTQPATPNNNVTTDRQGNVFQRDGNNWQQRSGNSWQNVNQNRQPEINNLNRQQQSVDRGNTRANNFNQSRPQPSQQRAPASRPSGGRGR